jgi:hypothetical protein
MRIIHFVTVSVLIAGLMMKVRGQESVSGLDQPGTFFPVLCWDPQSGWNNQHEGRLNGLESIRDCYFTIAGFVHRRDLDRCEQLGLKALAFGDHDTVTMRQWNDLWDDTTLTDRMIRKKIRRMVERNGDSKAVVGYYISDEPGASMYPRLAKAVEYVHKYAPGKLAYINLFPDYATVGAKDQSQLETDTYRAYLDRFATEVRPGLISYDNYMVQYSMDLTDSTHAGSYFRNLLAVRETALENGLPFWNIVSSNQIRPGKTIPSPANLLLQAYTTLAAGGRGVTWYTYYSRGYGYAPVDTLGRKTQTWYYLQEVNRQLGILGPIMNRMKTTGVYFSDPAPTSGLPLLPGRLVRASASGSPLMLGEFRDHDGTDYLMVVNLSLERSVSVAITLQNPDRKIQVISSVDGRACEPDMEKGLWLVAGQGILLRL